MLTLEQLEMLRGRVTRRDPLRLSLRLPEGRTDSSTALGGGVPTPLFLLLNAQSAGGRARCEMGIVCDYDPYRCIP